MGFEPTAFGLGSQHSTTELRPHKNTATLSLSDYPALSTSLRDAGQSIEKPVKHNGGSVLLKAEGFSTSDKSGKQPNTSSYQSAKSITSAVQTGTYCNMVWTTARFVGIITK